MGKIKKVVEYILHDRAQLFDTLVVKLGFLFSDKLYLSLRYRLKMGKWINWKNPVTYNEKLQWLKIYNRREGYTKLVDKYDVKEHVRKLIGDEYVIPTLAVWDNVDDIDFNQLPDQFVLKTTHSGGNTGVVICRDKNSFDMEAAKLKLSKSLKHDIYTSFREWPYKNVRPRIIAEKFISDNIHSDLIDYKFYCFDGVPKVLVVATGRNVNLCFDYYDMDFNHLPFRQGGPNSSCHIEKPRDMDKMIKLAEELSKGMPHVRIDMFNVNSRIYFGEYTFFDSSGMAEFDPEEWDYNFGQFIKLPSLRRLC